ncbi:hypothetical protein BCR35DRAFT_310736 [Leucosporidium creatinivorum]|uniref:CFEM domain-containing protein n=1 Tax=Leucosporidium creatinivorum TaxID=106004 RepID=A0A1Y2CUI0_9BASI|nr:hypothetical protein BCR35DRAFT_310736 [Leucosporidium creatinivorum]
MFASMLAKLLQFSVKVTEAPSLAPGVSSTNIAGLCAVPTFIQAYGNCLVDNCSAADAATGLALGQQVCAAAGAAVPTTGYTGAVSSLVGRLSSIPISSVASSAAVTGSSAVASASGAASSLAACEFGSSAVLGFAEIDPASSSSRLFCSRLGIEWSCWSYGKRCIGCVYHRRPLQTIACD